MQPRSKCSFKKVRKNESKSTLATTGCHPKGGLGKDKKIEETLIPEMIFSSLFKKIKIPLKFLRELFERIPTKENIFFGFQRKCLIILFSEPK